MGTSSIDMTSLLQHTIEQIQPCDDDSSNATVSDASSCTSVIRAVDVVAYLRRLLKLGPAAPEGDRGEATAHPPCSAADGDVHCPAV